MAIHAAQSDLQCGACGGQCSYAPADAALKCTSCGTVHPIRHDTGTDPAREFHYHPDTAHTEQTFLTKTKTHQCQTCGGEVVFVGPALSERCAYCDGPVVLKEQEASYQTMAVIPFRVTEAQAQERALAWVKARLAAPDDLVEIVGQGRVAGLYAPFWTFDSREAINYFAQYRVKRGDNWQTRSTSGDMTVVFDDLLMPASHHITPLIRDGILHDFRSDSLRSYDPAYLAGFAAERHQQSVGEGLAANAPEKDLLIRNQIKKRINKNRISHLSYKTDTTGIRYRRILLPVWILHYRYGDKAKKIVVCGIHGRTFGERPFSRAKLAGYAAAMSAVTILIGWVWGAAQLI